jgi:hypothetical protein
MSKNSNAEFIRLQIILQNPSNKTTRYCYGNKHVDQWNTTENPEINPCIFIHTILDHDAKNIHWRKDSLFKSSVEKTGYPHVAD